MGPGDEKLYTGLPKNWIGWVSKYGITETL